MRQMQKTQFLTTLLSCCICAFLFFLLFHLHYRSLVKQQNALNNMLSTAINEEQNVLNQMGSKATDTITIETQLKFIIRLYNGNYSAVRLLNEMVSLVSPDILMGEMKRNGNEVTLSGVAKSEDDVTRLMNDIAKSPWFNQPVLLSINADKQNENAKVFDIMFEERENK